MARPRKIKDPSSEGMVQVTASNRRALEIEIGSAIPDDVDYIITPEVLQDQLQDELFWDRVRMNKKKKDQERIDKISL